MCTIYVFIYARNVGAVVGVVSGDPHRVDLEATQCANRATVARFKWAPGLLTAASSSSLPTGYFFVGGGLTQFRL